MFGLRKRDTHREVDPAELHAMLEAGRALLIDVREAGEFATGHIAGAVNMPLSSFSPRNIPDPEGRTVGRAALRAGARSMRAGAQRDRYASRRRYRRVEECRVPGGRRLNSVGRRG